MSQLWRLSAHVGFDILGPLAERLTRAEARGEMDWSLYDEGDIARLDVLFDDEPDMAAFRVSAGLPEGLLIDVSRMADNERHQLQEPGLKPLQLGRFVLGSGATLAAAPGQIAIDIEAGDSFGSGHHPSTRGCLTSFDALLGEGFAPVTILDLGCGSAVLAIAAARACPGAEVFAIDNDAQAIADAAENIARNKVEGISCFHADGFNEARLEGRSHDLIFVNVYGRLHKSLAPGVGTALQADGRAILSGLLREDEIELAPVLDANGLTIVSRLAFENWITLVVGKR